MGGKPVFTVPSKSVINMDSGFKHKLLCDGPTFSAGTSCSMSCSYCYVPAQMRKQQPWLQAHGVVGKHEDVVIRRSDAVATVRQQLTDAKGRARFRTPEDRRVIYGSPLVDVAANMELVVETAAICSVILELTNWHIRLLSKSNLLPKMAQILAKTTAVRCPKCDCISDQEPGDRCIRSHQGCDGIMFDQAKARVIYGVSTGTLDDKLAQAFEHGCPLVSKRIKSLHWLQDNGYRAFAMVCPSLPQPSQAHYERFAADCAAALRYDRCEHVWCEAMNARGESFTRTHAALVAGNYTTEAALLEGVAGNTGRWEEYSRLTFLAHAKFCPPEKLRFMQYVTKDSRTWWEGEAKNGAVVL